MNTPSPSLASLKKEAEQARAHYESAWEEAEHCIQRAKDAENVYASLLERISDIMESANPKH